MRTPVYGIALLLMATVHLLPACASDSTVPGRSSTAVSDQTRTDAEGRPPAASSPDDADRKESAPQAPKASATTSRSDAAPPADVDAGGDRQTPETKRLLVPDVMAEKQEQMLQKATDSIRKTELHLREVDQPKLTQQQQETLTTVQNFLSEAKQALSDKDVERAVNLAGKAETLAGELPKVPKPKPQ